MIDFTEIDKRFDELVRINEDEKMGQFYKRVRLFLHTAIEKAVEETYKNVGSWFKLPKYIEFTGQLGKRKGGCSMCGGRAVSIRGRYPHTPKRKICPTCAYEILESIMDNCNNREALQEMKK